MASDTAGLKKQWQVQWNTHKLAPALSDGYAIDGVVGGLWRGARRSCEGQCRAQVRIGGWGAGARAGETVLANGWVDIRSEMGVLQTGVGTISPDKSAAPVKQKIYITEEVG